MSFGRRLQACWLQMLDALAMFSDALVGGIG